MLVVVVVVVVVECAAFQRFDCVRAPKRAGACVSVRAARSVSRGAVGRRKQEGSPRERTGWDENSCGHDAQSAIGSLS